MSSGMKCANCGKGVMYGHNVSHAKNRTRKIFKPNLHFARIEVDGAMKPHFAEASRGKRVRLCVKCLRRSKKKLLPAI